MDKATDKWPSTLIEILGIAEAVASRHGLESDKAKAISYDFVVALSDALGGLQTYIPKGDALKRALRDRKIYQDYRQGNADILAKQYKLTEAQIYSIYKTQYKLHQSKIQATLF